MVVTEFAFGVKKSKFWRAVFPDGEMIAVLSRREVLNAKVFMEQLGKMLSSKYLVIRMGQLWLGLQLLRTVEIASRTL